MKSIPALVLLLAVAGGLASLKSGEPALASELRSAFEVPPNYRDRTDGRRSPLWREEGAPVATAAEWAGRRAEIRAYWMEQMGPWPATVPEPRWERVESGNRGELEQWTVRLEIAPGVMHRALLLKPSGEGPFPAVVVPFYDAETSAGLGGRPHRDYGLQLARRGFVTLNLGVPGGDAFKPDIGGARCQPLSYLAYVAGNCLTALGRQAFVDPARIGIVGHSFGGKWAMFAACLDERFACGAWSDPGIAFDETRKAVNYWEPWYLGREEGTARAPGLVGPDNPRTGAYRRLVERGHDLHELHALMAPRPFFVSGGAEDGPDRWLVLGHALAVNHLLGFRNRVALHHRPLHEPTPEANELVYKFFEYNLRPQG